jgi:dCTP deaminase
MHAQDPWAGVVPGTLNDEDIAALAGQGHLITAEFSDECIRQACYELRASDTFWDLALADENKKLVLPNGFLLGPKRSVVCIAKESLQLPPDVLGRVLTKGQLFSIGILPVNTYADPGFVGRLGITLWNASNRYVLIKPDQRIAKIEFARMPKPVRQPYVGQHGYDTAMWPVPYDLYADPNTEPFKALLGDTAAELDKSFGVAVGDLRRSLDFYTRHVWLQLCATVMLFAVIFALHGELSLFVSVFLGVVANFMTLVVLEALRGGIPRLRRPFRGRA